MSPGTSGELRFPRSKIIGNFPRNFPTRKISYYFVPGEPQLTTGPWTHTWSAVASGAGVIIIQL